MNPTLKKFLCIVAVAFLLSVAYYGNYLPLRKSQLYIYTLRNLNSARSLQDLERIISTPLDAPSPIGQEELVRNTANIFMGFAQQSDNNASIDDFMGFIGKYYKPIIDRGRGMSFEQNLYILGAMNEFAFVKTKQMKYLEAASEYYSKGLEFGPKRPQFLYGVFDIYRIEGNVDGAKKIAEQILSQWPDDDKTREALGDFLTKVSAAAQSH
jgi:tetratricopeptide (TPR) repeat protein